MKISDTEAKEGRFKKDVFTRRISATIDQLRLSAISPRKTKANPMKMLLRAQKKVAKMNTDERINPEPQIMGSPRGYFSLTHRYLHALYSVVRHNKKANILTWHPNIFFASNQIPNNYSNLVGPYVILCYGVAKKLYRGNIKKISHFNG